MSIPITDQWNAIAAGAACAEVYRTHVEITGRDRVTLLHGLCTNDIKRLKPGDGCEAFLTNVQGKTIGYVYVFCGPNSLILESAAGESANIIRSLDRYIVREDAQLKDRTDDWSMLLVGGPASPEAVRRALGVEMPAEMLGHLRTTFDGVDVFVRRTPYVGKNTLHIVAAKEAVPKIQLAVVAAGGVLCSDKAVETARIEAGSPIFGRDITADNLPQEVDRNDTAISFTKGCYLGQETVARIDAMGHVNRLLRSLRFHGNQLPTIGEEIDSNGKLIAKITSASFSIRDGAPWALAYVRRGHHQPGTRIPTPRGDAEVVLPPAS